MFVIIKKKSAHDVELNAVGKVRIHGLVPTPRAPIIAQIDKRIHEPRGCDAAKIGILKQNIAKQRRARPGKTRDKMNGPLPWTIFLPL
jgi:hypothetical protein